MRVVFKRGAIQKLRTDPKVRADIERRAAAIRDACNAESTWGGYKSAPEDQNTHSASANVWTFSRSAAADNARTNRLLNNLDAGRA